MKVSIALRAKFWAFQLAQQLENRDSLSTLYTSFYGKFFGKDNTLGYTIDRKRVKTHLPTAFRTYYLRSGDLRVFDRFGSWVAKKIGEEDIVVCWGLSALPILKRAKELGIKTILERGSSHVLYQKEILFEEYERYGKIEKALIDSFSEQRLEREQEEYALADSVVVPSNFVKRTFLQHEFDESKVYVNPFGVNLSEFHHDEQSVAQEETFRVIFVGGMSFRKGVHYLLKAFDELALKDAELWLVGGMTPDIEPLIEKAPKNVHYFPPVLQHELAEYYKKASVFVMCSIEEGLAMVQVQAMACGLPLICTTNTGGEDLIDEGEDGFVLPIRDVEAVKEKIQLLYDNRDLCRAMGQKAGKKMRSDWSWDRYGDRAIKNMQALLS